METLINKILKNYSTLTLLATESMRGFGEGEFDIKGLHKNHITLRFNYWCEVDMEKLKKIFPNHKINECILEDDDKLDMYSYEIFY